MNEHTERPMHWDDDPSGLERDSFAEYRALSRAAIVSLVFAILASVYFLASVLIIIPALGILFAIFALRAIAKYPNELSGKGMAFFGLVVSGLILVGGTVMHAVVYATEVPAGYERISFQMLQPDPKHPNDLVPPSALALNGHKVFVKGYVHPSVDGLGPVRQFVLVPDMGTCCFGGQPKLTDMIEVTTPAKSPVRYSRRKRKLAGTLLVDTQLKRVDGLTGVFYQMQADMVE